MLPELDPLVPQCLRPERELLHADVGGGQALGDGGAAVLEPDHAPVQALQAVPQPLEALLEARAQVVVLVGGLGVGSLGVWEGGGVVWCLCDAEASYLVALLVGSVSRFLLVKLGVSGKGGGGSTGVWQVLEPRFLGTSTARHGSVGCELSGAHTTRRPPLVSSSLFSIC